MNLTNKFNENNFVDGKALGILFFNRCVYSLAEVVASFLVTGGFDEAILNLFLPRKSLLSYFSQGKGSLTFLRPVISKLRLEIHFKTITIILDILSLRGINR